VIDFVQGALVSIHHIGAAFHRYRVKTAVIERGRQFRRRGTFSFRVQDTVGFHRTNDVAALLSAGVKDGWVGIPTVHQNISARIIRERADDIQSHIDLRAILRTAAFQAIA